MRGKAIDFTDATDLFGITPAYAGKSGFCLESEPSKMDHPRLCGEKEPLVSIPVQPQGSPPPMRGKGAENNFNPMSNRITPAYAGKSFEKGRSRTRNKDHPRLCGEKFQPLYSQLHQVGSPPPMRGKDQKKQKGKEIMRITPAYAGKSAFFTFVKIAASGSPPPMRGKDDAG